jgi:hypothetical protein
MTVVAAIQQAINDAIATTNYNPPLPYFDDEVWKRVFDWDTHHARNNRLEWLGDR